MWCASCKADVAAEVTADHSRVRCAACGAELPGAGALRAAASARQARDLLDRWSRPVWLEGNDAREARVDAEAPADPRHSFPTQQSSLSQEPTTVPPVQAALPPSPQPAPSAPAAPIVPGPHWSEMQIPKAARPDANEWSSPQAPPAAAAMDGPADRGGLQRAAVDVQAAVEASVPRGMHWFQLAGQLLAYGGALVLTCGTALVLVGYFGGPAKAGYAPTGWIISSFGQLLLICGVITLVSCGMERTADEVRRRIDALGERLLRYDSSDGGSVPAPNGPFARYDAGDSLHQAEVRVGRAA
ncbi:MAG: hypothetical protein KY476_11910 [Planctomycetes bacterium]|nr:hypothetical protein [Planctomycetota bacterium]